jgi:hypothetical protein
MSQRLLRNRIVEVEDEDIQVQQYRQNSMEGIECGQEKVETGKRVSEIENFESSQESQGSESMYIETPKNVTPTTSKSGSEVSGTSGFDMQYLINIIQNMSEQLNKQSEQLNSLNS